MRFSLNVDVPFEKMELSRKRHKARESFKHFDRVPVGFCIAPRYFTPVFGLKYKDFYKDVEAQYYWQLQFAKYRIENIPEDYCQGPTITVCPYFDNVLNSSGLGAEISWPDNETPWAKPKIRSIEDVDNFEIPAPDTGLWGKKIEWWYKMKEFSDQTKVSFNDIEGKVEVGPLTIGGEGPLMLAIDLVGEDFYWWMIEHPEICHKFLDKITKALIQTEMNYRKIDPRFRSGFGIAEDSAQVMPAEMVKEFCVPYCKRLYDSLGSGMRDGRGMHMCGDSNHLHKVLLEDLQISSFNLFGYKVEPKVAADRFGGKIYLTGNVNPMLIQTGTKQEVKTAAMDCLKALAPCGGFMLSDGANICPGTPLENLAALTEAAEEYGMPHENDVIS